MEEFFASVFLIFYWVRSPRLAVGDFKFEHTTSIIIIIEIKIQKTIWGLKKRMDG